MAGGRNLFELLYERNIPYLDFNLRKILIECIVYDADIEADYYEMEDKKRGGKKDKYTLVSNVGMRELSFGIWLETKHPEYVDAEVTLLTLKEYNKIGQSTNYHRNPT